MYIYIYISNPPFDIINLKAHFSRRVPLDLVGIAPCTQVMHVLSYMLRPEINAYITIPPKIPGATLRVYPARLYIIVRVFSGGIVHTIPPKIPGTIPPKMPAGLFG